MIKSTVLIVYMVTAIMFAPNGAKHMPRYEERVFDTLEECKDALANPMFYQVMWETVQMAYPNHKLYTIGCGAWDMESDTPASNSTTGIPIKF